MKILCPTDLSPEANNAMAYAAKLAQESGSALTLLNVQILAELTPTEAFYGKEANLQNAQQVLDEMAREIGAMFKISCDGLIYSSWSRLVSKVDEASDEFDLIVMGTYGPETLAESVEGSKTYKLASWSRKPVLAIPFGVGYTEISQILFPYNFRGKRHAPTQQLLQLARATCAEVLCLQVIEETWTRSVELEIEESQKNFSQIWPADVAMKFQVVYGDEHLESIMHFMDSSNAELLAIVYNDQSWRESLLHHGTVRRIMDRGKFPILVVHR